MKIATSDAQPGGSLKRCQVSNHFVIRLRGLRVISCTASTAFSSIREPVLKSRFLGSEGDNLHRQHGVLRVCYHESFRV